jgi:hypothetical protein
MCEKNLHGVGSKLQFLRSVDAGAPQLALRIRPGDPLTVARVVYSTRRGKKIIFGHELLPISGVALQRRLGIEPEEKDAMPAVCSDRGLVAKRSVGDLCGTREVSPVKQPQIIAAIVCRLEYKIFAVSRPRSAAVGGRIAPSWQNGPRRMTSGRKLPQRHGVADGVDNGEAK